MRDRYSINRNGAAGPSLLGFTLGWWRRRRRSLMGISGQAGKPRAHTPGRAAPPAPLPLTCVGYGERSGLGWVARESRRRCHCRRRDHACADRRSSCMRPVAMRRVLQCWRNACGNCSPCRCSPCWRRFGRPSALLLCAASLPTPQPRMRTYQRNVCAHRGSSSKRSCARSEPPALAHGWIAFTSSFGAALLEAEAQHIFCPTSGGILRLLPPASAPAAQGDRSK